MVLALASRDLDLHALMRVIDKQHQSNKLKSLTLVAFSKIEKKHVVNMFFGDLLEMGYYLVEIQNLIHKDLSLSSTLTRTG